MADRNAYLPNSAGAAGDARDMKTIGIRGQAILTTDLTLNRTVGLCIAPAGFVVQSFTFIITDVDTNASPTHAFVLGDAAVNNRLATTATTGQAGGTLTTLAATGANFQYQADTEIIMTTTTAAATPAAGTITFNLVGYVE